VNDHNGTLRQPPLRGAAAELEALDWLAAARRLIDVLTTGRWAPEPVAFDLISLFVARAAGWFRAAGWTGDAADDERRAA